MEFSPYSANAATASNSFDSSVWVKLLPCRLLNSSRSNNSINDTKTVFIYLYTRGEPQEKVILEATRTPEEKITHVKISSPLPKPEVEDED